MIIFLYGGDTYRSSQKLKEIINHYKKVHKSGLNLKYFDFKKDSFEDFRDAFRSRSMFDEKKLIVLKNALLNSSIEEKLKDFLKKIKDSKDVVVFYEETIEEKKSLVKLLKRHSKSQDFKLLKGASLKQWTKKEFKKYSTKIEPNALDFLVESVGDNLWQMANEIKKLVNYKGKKIVQKKDVKVLVRPRIEVDIFKTIDAIAERDKEKALSFIKKHLQKGDSPTYLLAMINFQFRNLLMVKDLMEKGEPFNAILKETKLHPFVVKKSYNLARKFQFQELKKIHQKIFQADLGIKTGKITPNGALEMLILEI
jgi:DNA polymerase-3 subunit delta